MRPSKAILFALLIAGFVVGGLRLASAQQAETGTGYLGSSRSEYSIFVFGDSLAAGLWAGSQRAAKGNQRLRIKGRFKEGSGLARPQLHDWAKALPKIIESNPMDIAVVLIGSAFAQSCSCGRARPEPSLNRPLIRNR